MASRRYSTAPRRTAMKAAAPASDDMYDFSGVASDLAILRSQLLTLQVGPKRSSSTLLSANMDASKTIDEEEEEWYPPSPPVYDVAEKLLEVNRDFENDPTSTTHISGRLRWKPEANLVQIKWLYGNDCDRSGFISDGTEDDDTISSDECGGGGSSRGCHGTTPNNNNRGGLASQLAQELSFRLNMSSASSLFPPKMTLPVIEDASPVPEQIVNVEYEYEDEDFEEPSIADEASVRSPSHDIVTQMEAQPALLDELSSESSESCMTTMTTIKKSSAINKAAEQTKTILLETNNNLSSSEESRPSRPRTKTTVIRTHANALTTAEIDSQHVRSSSLPNRNHLQHRRHSCGGGDKVNINNNEDVIVVSNSKPPIRGGRKSTTTTSSSKGSHATIKVTHSSNNNSSNSCSSSEEGNTSSSSNNHHPSSVRFRSSSLQPTAKSRLMDSAPAAKKPPPARNVIMAPPIRESRTKTNKSSVYLNGNPGVVVNGNASRPRLLQRKISRNSISSNSSVSSQTTEDSLVTLGTSSSNSVNARRSRPPLIHHQHPSVVADVISPSDTDSPYFTQWKLRKREEKKLRQRRSFLEQQMRRH